LWGALAVGAGILAGALSTPKEPAQRWLKLPATLVFAYGVVALAGAATGRADPLNPIGQQSADNHQSPFIQTDSVDAVQQLILNAEQPVMVDLYADWCISCKVIERAVFGPPTILFFQPGKLTAYGRIAGERHKPEFLQEALQLAPAQ
ncbi:MAG: thioredoxin domain-containing protein, partial [Thalassolituus sp.]